MSLREDEPLFLRLEDLPLPSDPRPLAVALGVFDGVHRGHQALLAAAVDASGNGVAPAALTFDPHPTLVFSPARVPPMLGTLEERARLLHDYGAARVVVARFDRAFAALRPEEFVEDVLLRRLDARAVVVGEDFRFGCDRAGDVAFLRGTGERHGFRVHVIPPVFVDGVPARSTVIRQTVAGGQVEESARLLGRPYSLTGVVEHGRKLGRTLGYPTANLSTPSEVLVPGAGVYAGLARLEDGSVWRTAVSVGTNPTVTPQSQVRTVEAFLMDGFSGDLYGQTLTVEFHSLLRPMLKFDGLDALIAQMRRDVEEAASRLAAPARH